MEEVLASHPDVAECAVVGVHDELKGQIPVGFLVLKKGVDRDPHEIVTEVVQMVRQKIADGNDYKIPATIDDSSALTGVAKALSEVGYAKKQGASAASPSS